MAFLYGQFVAIDLAEREERRIDNQQLRLTRRNLRDTQDPFSLNEKEFGRHFRLNKAACRDLIAIFENVNPRNRGNHGIPIAISVLAALNFFANGSYQRNIGNSMLTTLSQPSVSRAISLVSAGIVRHCMRKWIKFPRNNDERNLCKARFLRQGLPHVVGAVDGTHVAIVKPFRNEHVYVNRKGYHSINVQLLCDNDLSILSIVARWPGSTHDAFIWRNSNIAKVMKAEYENGDHDSKLIGDSGYPCLPWLLVPLRNPNTQSELRFNETFKKGRSCVERCIGVIKGRFRCLLKHRVLHYSPIQASKIILACAVLHNIAIKYRAEHVDAAWDDLDLVPLPNLRNDQGDMDYRNLGNESRSNYINTHF